MKPPTRLVLAAGAALTIACGDDGTGPSAASLVGTWDASEAVFYLQSDPSVRVEVISAFAATVAVRFDADESFTLEIVVPGDPDRVYAGAWSIDGDLLTLVPDGIPGNIRFEASLSNDILTLKGGHVQFDVDDDETDDEAALNLVMERVLVP